MTKKDSVIIVEFFYYMSNSMLRLGNSWSPYSLTMIDLNSEYNFQAIDLIETENSFKKYK